MDNKLTLNTPKKLKKEKECALESRLGSFLDALGPVVTAVTNASLSEGVVPDSQENGYNAPAVEKAIVGQKHTEKL